MKLRIESNGTPARTIVTDAATGEKLDGVVAVRWFCTPGDQARASIELLGSELSADADAVSRMLCADCKRPLPAACDRVRIERGTDGSPVRVSYRDSGG